jgi:hypothetical protein
VRRVLVTTISSIAALALLGCTAPGAPTPERSRPAPEGPTPARAPWSSGHDDATDRGSDTDTDTVSGSVVRFTAGGSSVDVTIGAENAATRDFLSMLPLTLDVEEYAGSEKIAYLPRSLDTTGATGWQPRDGDLIYFAPWGNLGFYYDASGARFHDGVIHLGTFTAPLEELVALEDGDVVVERVR